MALDMVYTGVVAPAVTISADYYYYSATDYFNRKG